MIGRVGAIGAVAAVLLAVLASASLFTVSQTEQVLITQFGQPVRVIDEPGLHVKTPFVQTVIPFDRRLLNYEVPGEEVILGEGLPLPMKSACWMCPASKKHEVAWLARTHPELAEAATRMERLAHERGLTTTRGLGRRWSWSEFLGHGDPAAPRQP